MLLLSLAAAFLFAVPSAHANQSSFCIGNSTSGATTSPTFMTPGTATTTLSLTNTISRCTDRSTALTESYLLIQFTASSTNSQLNINLEYSMDGIDWYQNSLSDQATTSPQRSIAVAQTYAWKFASSTPGLPAGSASTNRDARIIKVESPTQWVRAVFALNPGGANGAVWAIFIGKQEQLAR